VWTQQRVDPRTLEKRSAIPAIRRGCYADPSYDPGTQSTRPPWRLNSVRPWKRVSFAVYPGDVLSSIRGSISRGSRAIGRIPMILSRSCTFRCTPGRVFNLHKKSVYRPRHDSSHSDACLKNRSMKPRCSGFRSTARAYSRLDDPADFGRVNLRVLTLIKGSNPPLILYLGAMLLPLS